VAQRGRQNCHEMLDSGVGPPHVSALLASRRCGRITAVLALLRRPIASLGYGTSADQKTGYRGLSYQVQTRLMTSIGLSQSGNMIPSER
jgi:hypothetical protein